MILLWQPWLPPHQGRHFFSKVLAATSTDNNVINENEVRPFVPILPLQPLKLQHQPTLDIAEALDLRPGTAELLKSRYCRYQVPSTDY
jgi:hypothetical protein